MSEQPILFEKIKQKYGAYPKPMMVNLEVAKTMDRKSQTRRAIKTLPIMSEVGLRKDFLEALIKKSKWKKGDVLWIREPARVIYYQWAQNLGGSWVEDYAHIEYLADGHIDYHWDEFPEEAKSWLWECKGIPNGCCKTLARDFRIVTDVRVERLQDITEEGCLAEGMPIEEKGLDVFQMWWGELWNSTASKGYKWEDNPYVFVYEFEKVEI